MNGCIITGTPIAVDFWQVNKHPGIKLFFLTHLHGDHVVGLTSSWRRPIHCSPVTAQLLEQRYGVDPSILRPLDVDQTHLLICCQGNCCTSRSEGVATNNQGSAKKQRICDSVTVTVMDANHCPGAVMFLFEGSFGKILHTGDFRFTPDMIAEGSLLSKHIGSIDRLYVDNTYCSPKCIFPTRQEALEQIVQIAKDHANYDVVFGVRCLGKEELLAAVALALKEWINIPPSMLSVVTSLGFPNLFKTGEPDQRLRVVPFQDISRKFVKQLNERKPTIVILPTALYQGISGQPYANTPEVFVVPYSDHSSYTELCEFVSKLKPACVLPIVKGKVRGPFGVDISSREDMSCFKRYLSSPQNAHHVSLLDASSQGSKKLHNISDSSRQQCGFENLFPDFFQQPPPLRKKQSFQRKPRKTLWPKGVNYLCDDVEDESNDEKGVLQEVTRSQDDSETPQANQTEESTVVCVENPLEKTGAKRNNSSQLCEAATCSESSVDSSQRGNERLLSHQQSLCLKMQKRRKVSDDSAHMTETEERVCSLPFTQLKRKSPKSTLSSRLAGLMKVKPCSNLKQTTRTACMGVFDDGAKISRESSLTGHRNPCISRDNAKPVSRCAKDNVKLDNRCLSTVNALVQRFLGDQWMKSRSCAKNRAKLRQACNAILGQTGLT